MNDVKQWYHHKPAGSQHTAGGFVTDSPDRLSVDAQMICHVHRSQEWGRLIAAAPDMLEALISAVELIEAISPVEGDTLRRARAAIKKARGER